MKIQSSNEMGNRVKLRDFIWGYEVSFRESGFPRGKKNRKKRRERSFLCLTCLYLFIFYFIGLAFGGYVI